MGQPGEAQRLTNLPVSGCWSADGAGDIDTALTEVLTQLYPPFVSTVLGPLDDRPSSYPEERRLVGAATVQRQREFFGGRACAHAALRALGVGAGPIGIGGHREPLWPPNVVGSISHAGTVAGAAVARVCDAWGIGLDIEPLEPPLSGEVERIVEASSDPPPGSDGHPLDSYRTKVAFSAKECVFKCLYPGTGWLLDFSDVSVTVDLEGARFAAAVSARFLAPGLDLTALVGGLAVCDGYVVTALCIPAHPG